MAWVTIGQGERFLLEYWDATIFDAPLSSLYYNPYLNELWGPISGAPGIKRRNADDLSSVADITSPNSFFDFSISGTRLYGCTWDASNNGCYAIDLLNGALADSPGSGFVRTPYILGSNLWTFDGASLIQRRTLEGGLGFTSPALNLSPAVAFSSGGTGATAATTAGSFGAVVCGRRMHIFSGSAGVSSPLLQDTATVGAAGDYHQAQYIPQTGEVLTCNNEFVALINPATGARRQIAVPYALGPYGAQAHYIAGLRAIAVVQSRPSPAEISVRVYRASTLLLLDSIEVSGFHLQMNQPHQVQAINGTTTYYSHQGSVMRLTLIGFPIGKVSIASIIRECCARSDTPDIDVADHEQNYVDGYALYNETDGHQAIEALRPVGLFDIVESDDQIKFPARGKPIVATLTAEDLGVALEEDSDRPPAITTRKTQDVELPRQIRFQYMSSARDFETGEQLSPARIGTVGLNDVTVKCPVVLEDARAAQAAEITQRDAWISRYTHELQLDQAWASLEGADPVLVPIDGRNYRVRIATIDDVGTLLRKCVVVRDDDGAYVSTATASAPQRGPNEIVQLGDTDVILIDVPAMLETDDDAGVYTVAMRTGVGDTWAGARLHKSVDGTSYSSVMAYGAQGIIGTVVSCPDTGDNLDTGTWNDDAEYVVDIVAEGGVLENRTDAAVFAGANAAAVGEHGRWHLFQFANATLILPGRYRLTRLLLGRRGTEHLVDQVVPGDTFVLVSGPGVYRSPVLNSEIGAALTYRAVTNGAMFSSALDFAFTGQGQALECFSPTYIRGERDTGGDLTITWLRRDRLGQTLRDGVDTAMSETTEAYVVEIYDGADVVRTIAVSIEEAEYSAADQTTDFGSPQAAVDVRVYQLSAVVGRGTPGEATV